MGGAETHAIAAVLATTRRAPPTQFGALKQDVVWSIIRNHDPVREDGVTPFSGEVTFDSLDY